MEEKRQKKIKASPRPRKLAGYMWEWKRGREKLPCPGRGLVLIQEKKQKKIKASPRPGNLVGYVWGWKMGPGKLAGYVWGWKMGYFFLRSTGR